MRHPNGARRVVAARVPGSGPLAPFASRDAAALPVEEAGEGEIAVALDTPPDAASLAAIRGATGLRLMAERGDA